MKPVYIADDSADQRYLLGYFIKRIYPEHPVVFFERAQTLLDTLSTGIETGAVPPMVIFLDLQMPGIDGYKTLQIIKQLHIIDKKWAEVPVIIYSSYSEQDVIQKCLDAGALAFLQKPVDLNELKNLLISLQP